MLINHHCSYPCTQNSSKQKPHEGKPWRTHHGPPEVPISQGCTLLIPVGEGEDHQHHICPNAFQVSEDGVPDRLIQCVERFLTTMAAGAGPACWWSTRAG